MDQVCLGEGFVPYHFSVIVQESEFKNVVTWAKSHQSECREKGTCGQPATWLQKLEEHPAVLEVAAEGPYSSSVIPVAMGRFFGNCRSILMGWGGQGPMAEAIQEDLRSWDIDVRLSDRETTDSSVEISVRSESFAQHETVRLHPTSRTKQIVRFRWPEDLSSEQVGLYFMTKLSEGRAQAGQRIFEAGGLCSLRISMFTRRRTPDEYFPVLPTFHHAVVSRKDMSATARAAKLSPPRGWPKSLDPTDPALLQLADYLGTYETKNHRLVIFNALDHSVFVVPGLRPVLVAPPPSYDKRTRTSRMQGAAGVCGLRYDNYVPSTQQELEEFANTTIQAAYRGTESRPSTYPTSDFQPVGSWIKE